MFTLEESLQLIRIDVNYIQALYNVCSEVYYRPNNYENKPYIGFLINNNRKYVIPLSSAKSKHTLMNLMGTDYMILHEQAPKSSLGADDIYISTDTSNPENVTHLLSILDTKKMIPVIEGVYSTVNINPEVTDTPDELKYKALLNKEYSFCVRNTTKIINMATNIYDKQMRTGKITRFCCDFKKLECVADEYVIIP